MKTNGTYLMGYWFGLHGNAAIQWLAGAHETGILTDNRQPTTNNLKPITYNLKPPPTNACGRSRGHASGQGDRSYEARPIFPFRGSDQPFGYPIPRAFA